MNATTISFDIAKGVIQLHGVDACFAVTPRKRLSRTGARKFFASLPPCLVGMEACGGARYWARELASFGHTARPISPLYVKPRVKRSKTDAADAAASASTSSTGRKPSLSGESAREMMTDRSRAGERQTPQSEWRVQARLPDWEPIRGFHQAQRLNQSAAFTSRAHDRARPVLCVERKNSLASPGPSTHSLAITDLGMGARQRDPVSDGSSSTSFDAFDERTGPLRLRHDARG
jgi:hypothetical protein